MNTDQVSCVVGKGEVGCEFNDITKLIYGDVNSINGDVIHSVPSSDGNNSSLGSTSGDKASWDETLLGGMPTKDEQGWMDISGISESWPSHVAEAANSAWDNALIESICGKEKVEQASVSGSGTIAVGNSSCLSELGDVDSSCFSSDDGFVDIPIKHLHQVSTRSDRTIHDDEFVELYHTEMEFQELMSSATDPVGKFLKTAQLSAQDALELNLHTKLLAAPKTPRTKYGKRKFVSKEERYAIQKERNKLHARATRSRRKIFKEVLKVREEAVSRSSQSEECSMNSSATNGHINPDKVK